MTTRTPDDEWVHVTCFREHPIQRVARYSCRLTQSGRVNLHDVNRWLRDSDFKVPLRYTEGGIRKRNLDVGWPAWCVMEGSPPEVYSMLSPEELANLREALMKHDPSKMTPQERAWIGEVERNMQADTASAEDIEARAKFLAEMALRPADPDEW